MSSIINLGLIQTHATEDKADNLRRHIALIREAAKRGAHVVCLQELFLTPYFCKREETALFDLADPIPGDTTKQLGDLARELGVVIIASMFEKRAIGLYHNTAAIIDADGEYMGKFRKMHIPEDPGFNEKFYFTPGDLGYKVWDTKRGRLGVLVCWDQWYPEAARLTAMSGAQILFYPTAIGWLKSEKAELGKAQHTAWETVQRGHAVANGCYVAAVNRVGVEEETEFWGQSFVANPYGEIVAKASPSDEEILMVPCDIKAMEDFRRIWPFFRDRRIDSYSDLTKRWRDDG
ncbi:carbon-nitrogen hydrolase [Roseimicrobium sp. ORNL1]|uniref:carbon-nitrogen hydrolase n=1 Tax=Roseimicrobium sp. ORNL1 TaxID=2711231 RepID=UPI0013E1B07B|nr:carbon-nitrogen hydrolase [Roseimicrobium sp. ORNL1]QIF00637.1 carbon-nitrogen hydrolase [Roseimicrobium sp. ORNL1]